MNRIIKEATVQRYHYDNHDQLRTHLTDFLTAYNFAKRLKTLRGLTIYEFICKCWQKEPDSFIFNPTHQMPGLNTGNVPHRSGEASSIHLRHVRNASQEQWKERQNLPRGKTSLQH